MSGRVHSRAFAYIFGGYWRGIGINWTPNLWRRVNRYYREGWGEAGYSLRGFVSLTLGKR